MFFISEGKVEVRARESAVLCFLRRTAQITMLDFCFCWMQKVRVYDQDLGSAVGSSTVVAPASRAPSSGFLRNTNNSRQRDGDAKQGDKNATTTTTMKQILLHVDDIKHIAYT